MGSHKTWWTELERWFYAAYDGTSFGFIQWLQARHQLPRDAARQLESYVLRWSAWSPADYYSCSGRESARVLQVLDRAHAKERVSFESPIRSGYAANDRATFLLFPCLRGWEAPTLFLTHGLLSVSDVGYRMWARALNARGWNVIFPHLPYHYSRRPPGSWNGEWAVSADFVRTAEGVRQAVVELRIWCQWLRAQGCQLIGLWGTSYGGWVGTMLSGVEARLNRLALVSPIADLDHAIWQSPAAAGLRMVLARHAIGPELAAPHYRFSCPSQVMPLLDASKAIFVAGSYDAVAPPDLIKRMHGQWTGSVYAEVPQGHVGYRLMPTAFRLMQQHWAADFEEELAQPEFNSGAWRNETAR